MQRLIAPPLFALLALSASTAAANAPRTFIDVDAGSGHTCAVTSCGEVYCFGRNDNGQAASRYGLGTPRFEEVTVGWRHTCALDSFGRVSCWGDDTYGQLQVPQERGPFQQVDAGNLHTCALTDAGEPVCWGYGAAAEAPAGLALSELSAGNNHTCGITDDALAAVCWGNDAAGQSRIGVGVVPGDTGYEEFRQISAGQGQSCAFSSYGYGYCWGVVAYGGRDFGGRFLDDDGDGVFLYPATFFRALSVGAWGTCAVYHSHFYPFSDTSHDEIWCWGYPWDMGGAYEPPIHTAYQVSVGADHACAVTQVGELLCWGGDGWGKATPPELSDTCGYQQTWPITPRPIFPRFSFGG